MSYQAIDTAAKAARAPGDLLGKIETALLKKAALIINSILPADDQRQVPTAKTLADGSAPDTWNVFVLIALDLAGKLATPTDQDIDTAVTTAWDYIVKSR